DVNALNEMLITNKGTVHEPSNKILLPEMNTKKKALAEQSKFVKNDQKHNCKHIEERIKTENSIISLLHTKHPQTSLSTGITESLGDENNHYQEQCNANSVGNNSKQTSDEEYETDIDENDSDTSNVACVKKSVQASARVLSGIIPVKGDKCKDFHFYYNSKDY
ncbi:hypothetical protein PV328_012072, partial [Microctonus aethiopoides]